MQPRLKLDIGWRDLLSIPLPLKRSRAALESAVAAHAPPDFSPVVGLSVRSLFHALLMETAAGRPVAMSAVTVSDMASLAVSSGSPVRPVDIDLATLLPSPEIARAGCSDDAGMLVLAHLYGSRCPVDAIALACAAPGRLLVEDCAQAFDGNLRLSAGADVALYSFGPIKTATALGGAIALFRDPDLAERVRARMSDWPRLGDAWFLRRACKFAVLKLVASPVLYGLLLAVLARTHDDPDALIGSLARGFAGRPIAEAVRRQPPPRLLRLLERRLRSWRPRADATASLLDLLSRRLAVPGLAARPALWWLAPVMAQQPDALVAGLRRRGFDATRGTTSLRALAGDGSCQVPVAKALIASVVYLPKPVDLAASHRLADAVEQAAR